jgi:hypothetical protein
MRNIIVAFGLPSIIAFSLVFSSLFQEDLGPHDGRLKKVEDYFVEIKSTDTSFYTFLLNSKQQPISNKGTTCEARFFFPDSTVASLDLKPYKEDGFTVHMSNHFVACKITYHALGKTIWATFEEEKLIAKDSLLRGASK